MHDRSQYNTDAYQHYIPSMAAQRVVMDVDRYDLERMTDKDHALASIEILEAKLAAMRPREAIRANKTIRTLKDMYSI